VINVSIILGSPATADVQEASAGNLHATIPAQAQVNAPHSQHGCQGGTSSTQGTRPVDT